MAVPRRATLGATVRYQTSTDVPDSLDLVAARYGIPVDALRGANLSLGLMTRSDWAFDGRVIDIPIPGDVRDLEWEVRLTTAGTLGEVCEQWDLDPYRFGAPRIVPEEVWHNVLNANFRRRVGQGAGASSHPGAGPSRSFDFLDPQDRHPDRVTVPAGLEVYVPHIRHTVADLYVAPHTPAHPTGAIQELLPEWLEELMYEHIVPMHTLAGDLASLNDALVERVTRTMRAMQSLDALDVAIGAVNDVTSWESLRWLRAGLDPVRTTVNAAIQHYNFLREAPSGEGHARVANRVLAAVGSPRLHTLMAEHAESSDRIVDPFSRRTMLWRELLDHTLADATATLLDVPHAVGSFRSQAMQLLGVCLPLVGASSTPARAGATPLQQMVLIMNAAALSPGSLTTPVMMAAPGVTAGVIALPLRDRGTAALVLESSAWKALNEALAASDAAAATVAAESVNAAANAFRRIASSHGAMRLDGGPLSRTMVRDALEAEMMRGVRPGDVPGGEVPVRGWFTVMGFLSLLGVALSVATAPDPLPTDGSWAMFEFYSGALSQAAGLGQLALATRATGVLTRALPRLAAVGGLASATARQRVMVGAMRTMSNLPVYRFWGNVLGMAGGAFMFIQGIAGGVQAFQRGDGLGVAQNIAIGASGVVSVVSGGASLASSGSAGSAIVTAAAPEAAGVAGVAFFVPIIGVELALLIAAIGEQRALVAQQQRIRTTIAGFLAHAERAARTDPALRTLVYEAALAALLQVVVDPSIPFPTLFREDAPRVAQLHARLVARLSERPDRDPASAEAFEGLLLNPGHG